MLLRLISPHRVALLGAVALASTLLVAGCGGRSPPLAPEVSEPPPASEDPDWGDVTARARAATFRLYTYEEGRYQDSYDDAGQVVKYYAATFGLAFYIGNDEWISTGVAPSRDFQHGLWRGIGSARHPLRENDLRPVTPIGYDRATGIGLVRASGEGVLPLPLASALPPPCTRLVLAGYWALFGELDLAEWPAGRAEGRFPTIEEAVYGERDLAERPAEAPAFPERCDRSMARGTDLQVEQGVITGADYLVPGLIGTVVTRVATEAGIPILVLEPSDGMLRMTWHQSAWQGAPVVTAEGTVVGVLLTRWYSQAVALPAIEAAIARIRADAAARAKK